LRACDNAAMIQLVLVHPGPPEKLYQVEIEDTYRGDGLFNVRVKYGRRRAWRSRLSYRTRGRIAQESLTMEAALRELEHIKREKLRAGYSELSFTENGVPRFDSAAVLARDRAAAEQRERARLERERLGAIDAMPDCGTEAVAVETILAADYWRRPVFA